MFRIQASSLCISALFVATACGGTVGGQSAEEELRQEGEAQCRTACEHMAECEPVDSCDCACGCPADAPDCVCDVCDCGVAVSDVDECTKDCTEMSTEVLEEAPACADEVLALIDCVNQAACVDTEACREAGKAAEACIEQFEEPEEEPVGYPPAVPTEPGPGVVCSSTGGSGGSSGSGATECSTTWDCSNGSTYEVYCIQSSPQVFFECTCIQDGRAVGSVSAERCVTDFAVGAFECGFAM